MSVPLLLEIVALILLGLAALNVASEKFKIGWAGLFCWLLAIVLGGLKLG